jgi:glycosyltransferase involved in cell wall biosynthesis
MAEQSKGAGEPGRILFLTHALNLSGAAVHMTELGRGLVKRGFKVAIATKYLDEGKAFGKEVYEAAGFEVFNVLFPGYGLNRENVGRVIGSRKGLRKVLDEFKPTLVHVHAPTLCMFACAAGVPYVTTFNIAVNGRQKQRIARLVNRIMSTPFGQRVIAISGDLELELSEKLCIRKELIRKCTYAVDEARFSPATADQRRAARQAFGIRDGVPVTSMLARLEPRKNHGLLMEAVAKVKSRGVAMMTLLAGDGWEKPYIESLYQKARDLGLDESSLKFVGQQPARRVYDASDACVLPSLQEGFPLTIVEAMHCGVVPIRTPSEGAAEQIVDGKTGYIVPFGEPDTLADRLIGLATDGELRSRLSHQAREFALAHFSLDSMLERTIEIYTEASKAYYAG